MKSPDLRRALVGGAELHYQERGSGEPVVLVHGSLGDYRSWSLQAPALANRFRVITYSRRYHYPNAWTGDGLDYSADLHADDLAGLMDALQIGSAHIVSASYGSYVALIFARRHPDRVHSLVIAEPPMLDWARMLPGGNESATAFLENAWSPAREAFIRGDLEEGVRLFIDGVVGRKGAFDGFHTPIRQALLDNALEMRAECLSDRLFPPFGCEDARRIKAPVLLLSGEKSPAFFRIVMDELGRCLPKNDATTFPGASHNLNSARPRLYNDVVMTHLDRNADQK